MAAHRNCITTYGERGVDWRHSGVVALNFRRFVYLVAGFCRPTVRVD